MKSDKKRVCIVQNSVKTLYIFRRNYIEKLISEGFVVFCLARGDSPRHNDKLIKIGCVVHDYDSSSFLIRFFKANFLLFKLQFNYRFNITVNVHFLSSFILHLPSLFFIRSKVNVVIEGIGSYFNDKPIAICFVKWLLRFFCKNRVFMNNTELELLGKKGDLVLKGIGIDLSNKCKSSFLSSNLCQSRVVNLLYVGRLVGDKGIYDLLKSVEQLISDGFKFNLDIVGDIYPSNPSSMNSDEVEFYSKKFHGLVNFHGFIDNLDNFYRKADLLLLPSKHEGFPVVVMEANSFGVPALTYDVIGCRDAVENDLNGFLVNYGDLSEFTEIIKSRRYLNLKTSSFDYAIKNFDINIKTDLMFKHMNL